MSETISRRELGRRGLIGVATLALPSLGLNQQTPEAPKPDPKIDEKIARIEAKLAKPLSERAKEIMKGSIAASEAASETRWKAKLPENSEPCFTYHATPKAEPRR